MSSVAYYMVFPYLGLFFSEQFTTTNAWKIGIIVGVAVFFTRSGAIVMLAPIQRWGGKGVLMAAYIVGAMCLLAIDWFLFPFFIEWLIAAAILGIAFAAGTLSMKTWLANAVVDALLPRAYAALNWAANFGAFFGPLVGGWLIIGRSRLLIMCAAGSLLITVALAAFMPHSSDGPHVADSQRPSPSMTGFPRRLPVRFVLFLLAGSLTWFAYAQLFIVFPTYIHGHLSERFVGLLFAVNALGVIGLQRVVAHYVQGRGSLTAGPPWGLLIASQCLLGAGLMSLNLTPIWGAYGAITGIVLFTGAEMIWSPYYDVLVVTLRESLTTSGAFAYSGLFWGLAESLGAGTGLAVMSVPQGPSPMILGGLGALGAAGVLGILGRRSMAHPFVPPHNNEEA